MMCVDAQQHTEDSEDARCYIEAEEEQDADSDDDKEHFKYLRKVIKH